LFNFLPSQTDHAKYNNTKIPSLFLNLNYYKEDKL
jgi:hypothetical protein